MNRDEAIKLLRGGEEGIKEWNRRREEGEEIPDLSGINLDGAYLHGVNLDTACLCGASLQDANLNRAKLRNADLRQAKLRRANLIGAYLWRAKVHNATCGWSVFGNVDLSSVRGLETVKHEGPSSVGVDTLLKSRGDISSVFLRGCGVPENLIEYLPSLVSGQDAIQSYSCFISYSGKDEEFAKRLHSRMREEKMRVWFAPQDIKGGEKLHEQIDEAIRVCDKLLLVLSEESMASEWVKIEIRKARQRELREKRRMLFPIRLVSMERIQQWECIDGKSGTDLAAEICEYFIPDFSNWKDHDSFEESFDRLLRDLQAGDTEQDQGT